MSKITRGNFRRIVKFHELREAGNSLYLLMDCNVWFEHNASNCFVYVRGLIPMDLATEMQVAFKNTKGHLANCTSHILRNPKLVAKHANLDIDELVFVAEQGKRKLLAVYNEVRDCAVTNDYENCYLDFSIIYTPEAFDWFIRTTKSFYNTKKDVKSVK